MIKRIVKVIFIIFVLPGLLLTFFIAEFSIKQAFYASQEEKFKDNNFHFVQTYHLLGLPETKNSYISTTPVIDKEFISDNELTSIKIQSYSFTLFDNKNEVDAFSLFISNLKIEDENALINEDELYYISIDYHLKGKIETSDGESNILTENVRAVSSDKETYFAFSYLPNFLDKNGKFLEIDEVIIYYWTIDDEKERLLKLSNYPSTDFKDQFSNDLDRYINNFTVENNSLSKIVSPGEIKGNDNIYHDESLLKVRKKYNHFPYTYGGTYVLVSGAIIYFLFFHENVMKNRKRKLLNENKEK